jgi:hypothetical protein
MTGQRRLDEAIVKTLAVLRVDGGAVARVVLAGVRGPDQLLNMPGTLDATLRQVSRLAAESPTFKGILRGGENLVVWLKRVIRVSESVLMVQVTSQSSTQPLLT